jgi:hypothetical protein
MTFIYEDSCFRLEWSVRGSADVYVPMGGLTDAAAKLEGFPRRPSDITKLEFGDFGPQSAGGASACASTAWVALVTLLSKRESSRITMPRRRLNPRFFVCPLKQQRWIHSLRSFEAWRPGRQGIALLRASGPG